MPIITSKKIAKGEKEKLLAEIGYYDPKWVRVEMPEHLKDFFFDLMIHNQFDEFRLKLFRNSPRGKKFYLCFEIIEPGSRRSIICATVPVTSGFDAPENLEATWLACLERIELAYHQKWIDREESLICRRYAGMPYKPRYRTYQQKAKP